MRWFRSLSRERLALGALLLCCLVAAGGFALVTPYGEAPDEPAHLLYVDYIVTHHGLPPIGAAYYTNEAVQPPLYYALCAAVAIAGRALTGADLSAPLAPPLQANPAWYAYTSNQIMLHPPEERRPLWPFVFRSISILCGLGLVALTYATARTLAPPPASKEAPEAVALVAAAFAALLPQANFIRASVSNESLAALIGAWIVLLLVQHLVRPYSRRRVVWLGVALGLGLLTKASTLALWPAAGAVLLIHRAAPPRRLLGDLVRMTAVVGAIAAPFYLWRWSVYGDPTANAAWAEMLPPHSPWRLTDLFWLVDPFREALWQSFWGVFGWQIIPLPGWMYYAFLGVTLLAAGGGGYLVARRALRPAQQAACGLLVGVMLLLYLLVILFSLRLIAWQGREMFPALSSICVLFGVGLGGLALGRAAVGGGPILARWRRPLAAGLAPAVTLGLLAVNLFSIVYVVAPQLTPPPVSPAATRALTLMAVTRALRVPPYVPAGGRHTFADVPPGDPAFAAVEAGAHAGLIAGYACGGAGEPCDAAGRPYFRPAAPLARGHLAKILVTVLRWPLVAPAPSPFADVAPDAPLYAYMTTAAAHGVLTGTPCRAPRLPCDAASQPYFGPSQVVFLDDLKAILTALR